MKTKIAAHTPEILNEIYLYHCAGGHTRSEMAKAKLIEVGFRFDGSLIYWPDGVKLAYNKSGDIDYRKTKGQEEI